jgi:hypothetical protein
LRRPLRLLATGLILLGTEVATGAVSLAFVRLWLGFQAVVSGSEFVIATPRYLIGVAILLGAVGVIAGMVWVEGARRQIVPDGSACPNCGTLTKRVRRRRRHRLLSRVLETSVTRRRCGRCGWSGLVAT